MEKYLNKGEKDWSKIVKKEETKALKNKEYDTDPTLHFF